MIVNVDDIIYKIQDIPGISRLPFVSRFAHNEEVEEEEEVFKLQGKLYVLLVDDQEEDLAKLKNVFENAGALVTTADSGVAALECARKDKFNLILVAKNMHRMDGVQFMKNLMNSPDNKNRDTAVILMLRRREPRHPEEFLEYGFERTLMKPIGVNTVMSVIISKATKNMLPENEVMLRTIQEDAEKEQMLSDAGIDFQETLDACKGDVRKLYAYILKFCKLTEDIKDRMPDELLDGDTMKYMEDARTMRDISLKAGAERLYDFFDDHVNMAKDESLEIAAKNYPALEREWDYIYNCFTKFNNTLGIDTSILYEADKPDLT